MLTLLQTEHQRCLAAGDYQEEAHPVLRHAEVGAVHHMRRDLVA